MKRTMTVLVALVVLAGAVVPATAVAQPPSATAEDAAIQAQIDGTNVSENASEKGQNASVSPGTMLAGAIGAQQAEFAGAVEHRAFGLEVAAAATNDSKGQVLARTHAHLQDRSKHLEERLDELETARANGTISEAQYQAQMTEVVAEVGHVRNMANSSDQIAKGLPEATLQENGINVTAIQELQRHAENMTGSEVARMARHIAGPNVGHSFGAHAGGPMMGMPGGPIDGMPGPDAHYWGNETTQTENHRHNGQSGPQQTTTDEDDDHMMDDVTNTTTTSREMTQGGQQS